jgi:hypothetical protein
MIRVWWVPWISARSTWIYFYWIVSLNIINNTAVTPSPPAHDAIQQLFVVSSFLSMVSKERSNCHIIPRFSCSSNIKPFIITLWRCRESIPFDSIWNQLGFSFILYFIFVWLRAWSFSHKIDTARKLTFFVYITPILWVVGSTTEQQPLHELRERSWKHLAVIGLVSEKKI